MGFYPLFFLGTVFSGWGLSLARGPVWALMTYVFIYFNIPSHQWWGGQVPDLRWSLIAAAMMLLSCAIHSEQLTSEPWHRNRLGMILLGLLFLMILVAPFTPNPTGSWNKVYDYFRYVLVFFLVNKILVDFKAYRLFTSVLLFCTFYIAVLAHHYFRGGRLDGVGLPDASDANLLAALIVLLLPLFVVYMLTESGWRRLPPFLAFVLVVNMFVMCGSRGAFVGFLLQGVLAFVLLRQKIGLIKTVLCCLLVASCLYSLMSPDYKSRLFGLEEGLQDETSDMGDVSAGRTEIWKYGLIMAADYPMGAGGGAFLTLSPQYIPSSLLSEGARASHNTYLMVLVEQGWLGLGLFLYFVYYQFIVSMRLLGKSRRIKLSLMGEKVMYHLYAVVIGVAGFWSAAFFIDRVYFEGIYLVVALIPVLTRLLEEQVSAEQAGGT